MSESLNLVVKFSAIDKLSDGLKKIIGAGKEGTRSIKSLNAENRNLQRQLREVNRDLSISSGNTTNLVNKQTRLEQAIAKTTRQIERQGASMRRINNIRAFSGAAAAGGAAASVAVTAPLVAFGREAFRAAMDAEELRSAFYVTFGQTAPMMEDWAARTGNALNRTQVELMQSANTFGIFFNQADPKKAAALSQQFAVLAQDLSSFYNVDPGTALDKLRSGLTGESEPLRDFGVFLTEAAVKAQALKMGIKPLNGELSEQQKIMARAGLIMASTANAQGDLQRTSGSTANQLRAANTAWANLSLVIGTELLPALTPLIKDVANLVKGFSGMSPGMRKFIIYAGIGAAVVGPLLIGIAGIAAAAGVLIPAFAAAGSAIAVVVGFLGGIPLLIGLVIAAVIGLGISIYYNWDRIKAAFSNGVAAVKGFFAGLPGWMQTIGGAIMNGLLMSLNPAAFVARLINVAKVGIAAFKAHLGIKSPSRLFMEMGGHMTAGLGMGIDRGARRPLQSMGRLAAGVAGAGALALSPAASARAGGGAAAPVTIHIHQLPGEDAKALASRVADELDRRQQRSRGGSYRDDF